MPKIIVKKAFTLSMPISKERLLSSTFIQPTEIKLKAGEQEVSDEVAAHPFVLSGADGCVETPAETKARIKARSEAVAKEESQRKADEQRILAEAEVAFKRATGQFVAEHAQ